MPRQMNMRDAKKPLSVHVKQCHIDSGKRKDPQNCMLAKAIKQEFNVESAAVHRNMVWIKFKGDRHITRYSSTPATRAAIAAFDKTLKKAVKLGMVQVPKLGMEAVLRVPTKANSLRHQRSKEMTEKDKVLRKANRERRGTGRNSPRDALTLQGVRSSQGYHL